MKGIPPANANGTAVPRPPRGRIAAAVTAALVCTLIAVSLSFLFFTGVVRLGTPRVLSVVTASKVDSHDRPVTKKSQFDGSEIRIYCCARLRAFEDTTIEARWYHLGAQVGAFSGRYGALVRRSTGKFLTSRGDVAFYMNRPSAGWESGSYSVRLYISGKRSAEKRFSIKGGRLEGGLRTYRDPGGLFTVGVPPDWSEADPATLKGASVGFTATGGEYPPRFVVLLTDFTSVDTAYLNSELARDGPEPSKQFQPYSLGDSPGARRDFEWDYESDGVVHRLHSIQVVVHAGDGKVYGIDCHSSADEYEANLPVLNAIINSFRLSV